MVGCGVRSVRINCIVLQPRVQSEIWASRASTERCQVRPLYSFVKTRIIFIQSKIVSKPGTLALAHVPTTHRHPSRASDVTLAARIICLLCIDASTSSSPNHKLQLDDRVDRAGQHLLLLSLQKRAGPKLRPISIWAHSHYKTSMYNHARTDQRPGFPCTADNSVQGHCRAEPSLVDNEP